MEKIIAIVPAAGLGSRLGLGKNKAFADWEDCRFWYSVYGCWLTQTV